MHAYLWVGLGSALGGMARFFCAEWAARLWGTGFPWGTLLVNVAGSFAVGVLIALVGPTGKPLLGHHAQQFAAVGFLGGYTTFSAFSLQTLGLLRDGAWAKAGANVAASVALCLIAVAVGYWLAQAINDARAN
ncbi:MAG: fluoride efflux transporter CrcB [Alphaproteobacteria bacterium]|nr:fluoride efflux transporter CrcB [Alphaproteobacteria bacterium]